MKKHKITFEEWFNSEEKLFVHCKTQQEADILCKRFNNTKSVQDFEKPPARSDFWEIYREASCYANDGVCTLFENDQFMHLFNIGALYEFEDITDEKELGLFQWLK